MSGRLKLDTAAAILRRKGFGRDGPVQRAIDGAVLRLSEPYVPRRTGALIASGYARTVQGSGEVIYDTPYARTQYYRRSAAETGGPRGPFWVERMKQNHMGEIIRMAAEAVL